MFCSSYVTVSFGLLFLNISLISSQKYIYNRCQIVTVIRFCKGWRKGVQRLKIPSDQVGGHVNRSCVDENAMRGHNRPVCGVGIGGGSRHY